MHSTPSTVPPPPGIDRAQATRLALLAAVRDTGSISAAARAVGLSYKGAWQILDAMNRQSSAPLFNRSTGGSGGGGTVLTVQGEALLSASAMVSRLANTLSNALTSGENNFSLLARLGLKTSARNQFTGRISQLEHGTGSRVCRCTEFAAGTGSVYPCTVKTGSFNPDRPTAHRTGITR